MVDQIVALTLVLVGVITLAIYGISHRKRKRAAQVMPTFDALAGEVGRVAEEGAAIHVALGSGGLLTERGMVSVAALQGLSGLTSLSAAYDTPPFITTGDPTLYLLADNQLRSTYARLGNERAYPTTAVRFTAPTPLLYAAMAGTLTLDEPIATNINLGVFDQEASLLAHAGLVEGAKLFGGAASLLGLAALYPVLPAGRLLIGEEIFAGGAEVKGRTAFWGSLQAQNVLRWLVILGILLAAGASFFGLSIGE